MKLLPIVQIQDEPRFVAQPPEKISALKDNKGTKRICENCQDECLTTLYCEHLCSKLFKENFSNWSSENNGINDLIQKCQMETFQPKRIIEWIPYNNLQIFFFLFLQKLILKTMDYLKKGNLINCISGNKKIDDLIKGMQLQSSKLGDAFQKLVKYYESVYGMSQDPETKDYFDSSRWVL
ncbi:hypothetical protein RhiirB3_446364 [Rhizophagus irregularis]|nr:hypothetical protein RhiirB3_446364 [Rhizophagus irregularis]